MGEYGKYRPLVGATSATIGPATVTRSVALAIQTPDFDGFKTAARSELIREISVVRVEAGATGWRCG